MSQTESNILLDICNTHVYKENAFFLLAANVDDSPSKLKKRANDFQNAVKLNELRDEYPKYLCPDTLPSEETILEAKKQLQDPPRRFLNMLFWFWPIESKSSQDIALRALRNGNNAEACRIWNETVDFGTPEQILIARHNLAIYTHMKVLQKEMEILQSPRKRGIKKDWETSYAQWMELYTSEDFWSYLKEKARSYDDPRLTTGFVRRMRTFLPQAIVHINAGIACDYLRADPPFLNHFQRHKILIESYKLNGATYDSIFLPIVSTDRDRINTAIEDTKRNLSRDQQAGKRLAGDLLSTTKQSLELIKQIFGPRHIEYRELADDVAKTIMQCAVAFANQTGDWNASLRLLSVISSLACSQKLKTEIAKNEEILKGNLRSAGVGEAIKITNSAVESANLSIKKADKGEISLSELSRNLRSALADLKKAQKLAPGEKRIKEQIENIKAVIAKTERTIENPFLEEALRITNSAVELANRSIERANKGKISPDELMKSLMDAMKDLLEAEKLAPEEQHIKNQIDNVKKALLSVAPSLISTPKQSYSYPTYTPSSEPAGLKDKLILFFHLLWFCVILFSLIYYFVAWIWNKWF